MPARIITSACRVCGCTEDRACLTPTPCHWVRAEKGGPPLCSACSGTPGDMDEALRRIAAFSRPSRQGLSVDRVLSAFIDASIIARSARYRRQARVEQERRAAETIHKARPSRKRK